LTDFVRHSPRVLIEPCSGAVSGSLSLLHLLSDLQRVFGDPPIDTTSDEMKAKSFSRRNASQPLPERVCFFMRPGTTPQTGSSTKSGLTSAEAKVEMQKYLNN
jgi:hypothetical protein